MHALKERMKARYVRAVAHKGKGKEMKVEMKRKKYVKVLHQEEKFRTQFTMKKLIF